jgi:hypothetical protein
MQMLFVVNPFLFISRDSRNDLIGTDGNWKHKPNNSNKGMGLHLNQSHAQIKYFIVSYLWLFKSGSIWTQMIKL